MKKRKFLITAILLFIISFALSACGGISKEQAVGVWEDTYEDNGSQFSCFLVLNDDDTYTKSTRKDGNVISAEEGTYEVEGEAVILYEEGDKSASCKYKYKGGKLVNNNQEFSKYHKFTAE